MSFLAPTGVDPGDLAFRIDRRPYRLSGRLEDGCSRLASVLLGPASAWLGPGRIIRHGAGGRPLDLGNVVGLGFHRLCVHYSGDVGH